MVYVIVLGNKDSLEDKVVQAAKLKIRDFIPVVGLPLYRWRNLPYDTQENIEKTFIKQMTNIALLSVYNMSAVVLPMYYWKESLGL